MHNVLGAGIIITHEQSHKILLVKGPTGIWSFPKGHAESCDSGDMLKTAIRETREETSLIPCRDFTISGAPKRYGKHSYWFGYTFNSDFPSVQITDEHIEFGWFTRVEISGFADSTNCDIRDWVRGITRPLCVREKRQQKRPPPAVSKTDCRHWFV